LRLCVFFLILILAGCDGGAIDPAETVERYMQAKIEADRAALGGLLCAEMEANLDRETQTFETVTNVEIQGMACTFDESRSVVTCEGEIIAAYGGENTTFPLESYRVAQEDGEWKWCGEAE
jgi:hypothetical protein